MDPGTTVGDRFEIAAIAGRGGMGIVYRARDRQTGLSAAVKVLAIEASGEHRERFAREGRLLAELAHPAFVRALGAGELASGQLWLAMEWLAGEDLAHRLKREPLGAHAAVQLVARIAHALAAAHERGIVHRDIKPANLMLVDRLPDRAKIVDLGIARAGETEVTRTGAAIGTPRYMAPEQARGSRDVDARADVFSLGCVLFECLAGKSPFAGADAAQVLAKIMLEDAPPLVRDDLPAALIALVARMLAKQPADRPSASEVAAALESMTLGDAPPAIGVGTTEQRLVCAIFVAGAIRSPSGDGSDDDETATLARLPDRTLASALAGAVSAHRGRAEVLADGSLVVLLHGQDQAVRAGRCALALHALVPEAAIALAIGRAQGPVIERATELARRAGEIVVDDVTAGLLEVRFAIDGDALRRERDVATAGRRLLGRPVPCIGRERELGVLDALWRECVAEPLARAVVVIGGAGIGKSRLRYELVERVRAETWIGRGDPMTAGAPFAMLAQALRRVCGIVDDEPPATRHGKLRERVAHVPDPARVAEFLGELIGAETVEPPSVQLRAARLSPQLMGDQMLRACEDLFAAECALHPVLLVLEDLQWSDASTVQFVDAILRRLDEQPLMVLALARPDIDATFPRLWSARRLERMNLGELTRRSAEKLVREALGSIDAALINRIVERAAGNAFYLEELIRSVAEGHADQLPETVVAMAQARIEDLEPEARQVLRAASIFGQVFWRGGIAAVGGGEEWLDELVRRELITERRDSQFGGELEYTFRHALVREAAYAMLTDRDRMLGHRAAGAWLESAGEHDAIALAEHFLRGGEPARSIGWFRAAAERALEGNDLASAIDFAERAVACGGDAATSASDAASSASDLTRGELRALQAGAHVWRGEYAEAIARGEEALARLPVGAPAWLAAAAHVVDASARTLDHARVLNICERLATDDPGAAHVIALAMTTLLWHGDAALVARTVAQLDRLDAGDPIAQAWIYSARGWLALRDGDLAGALAFDTQVEQVFTELGDQRNACRQRANVGYGELMLGAYERAEASLREAIALATRVGLHQVTAQAQHNLGLVLARRGAIAEARAVERAALAAFDAQGNRRLSAAAHNYLALIELAAGDAAEALAHAQVAVDTAAADKPGALSTYLGTQAAAMLAVGSVGEALEAARAAMALIEEHGHPEEGELAIYVAHVEALRASGELAEAHTAALTAAMKLRAMAAKIRDRSLRELFLTAVPENAAIIRAAFG